MRLFLTIIVILTVSAHYTHASASSQSQSYFLPDSERYTGLVAAVFTPFDETDNQSIVVDAIPEQADMLVNGGVKTAYVCGTTGESLSLSISERKTLAEEWVKVGHSKGLRVIIHVGHEDVHEAVNLAKHAEIIGADAFAAMPPVFFKPSTIDYLYQTMAKIASGATSLPFFYYHIPEMTGSNPDMLQFIKMMSSVPNFQGIKFTSLDIMTYQQLLDYDNGKYDILFGKDQMLLAALDVGGKGAVGSTYNFAGREYNWIIGNFTLGTKESLEKAKEIQDWSGEMITWMLDHDLTPCLKKTMNLIAKHDFIGKPRLPIGVLDSKTEAELKDLLMRLHLL